MSTHSTCFHGEMMQIAKPGVMIFILHCSDVDLIVSLINAVNLPKMPLQLLSDIVDRAKVKQVSYTYISITYNNIKMKGYKLKYETKAMHNIVQAMRKYQFYWI